MLTISRVAVSTGDATPRASRPPSAPVPAVRLGRVWRVVLGERPRTWTIAPGGDADRADALSIRQRVYEAQFGTGWPKEEDVLDARAFLCVVRRPDGEAVASLRVIGPDDRPLEIESMLPLDELPAGARPGEMNRFAIVPESRRMSTGIHMALFQWAFALARRDRYSHFFVVAPRDVKAIYEFLLFRPVGNRTFPHPRLDTVFCTPMVLDLHDVQVRYHEARHAFASLLERQDGLAPELRPA